MSATSDSPSTSATTPVEMPRLSDSMEQGTILAWLKSEGAEVTEGEDLVEIETDKATMTCPAPAGGVLSILAVEGTSLPVGAPIASLGEAAGTGRDGEGVGLRLHQAGRNADLDGSGVDGGAADRRADRDRDDRDAVRATPVARRLARIHRVDISALRGTGPRGRVMRSDVAAAAGIATGPVAPGVQAVPARSMPSAAPQASLPPARQEPSSGGDGIEVRELTRLQQVVARRMSEAQANVPDFQVETEVAMDAALRLRAQLKDAATEGETPPSVNDIVVKACALALRSHPLANGSYRDGRFELHSEVNVGIAVAADQALIVPTITGADSRSLGSIAGEARRLSERVRSGAATPAELSGATFTVSNLGMFGMTAIKPVVNVPQAAILGVGATRIVLARGSDGEIVDRSLMTLTLTCDHRILYGAEAARFLAEVRALLEEPLRLML